MDNIQRAIEILKRNKPTSDPRLCGKELCNACDVAISAMQELQQYRATGLTPRTVEKLKENDKQSHKLAVQRAAKLDEYQAIGTVEECQGYKIHSQNISKLNSCNDCGKRNDCKFVPLLGDFCRINCYMWEAMS